MIYAVGAEGHGRIKRPPTSRSSFNMLRRRKTLRSDLVKQIEDFETLSFIGCFKVSFKAMYHNFIIICWACCLSTSLSLLLRFDKEPVSYITCFSYFVGLPLMSWNLLTNCVLSNLWKRHGNKILFIVGLLFPCLNILLFAIFGGTTILSVEYITDGSILYVEYLKFMGVFVICNMISFGLGLVCIFYYCNEGKVNYLSRGLTLGLVFTFSVCILMTICRYILLVYYEYIAETTTVVLMRVFVYPLFEMFIGRILFMDFVPFIIMYLCNSSRDIENWTGWGSSNDLNARALLICAVRVMVALPGALIILTMHDLWAFVLSLAIYSLFQILGFVLFFKLSQITRKLIARMFPKSRSWNVGMGLLGSMKNSGVGVEHHLEREQGVDEGNDVAEDSDGNTLERSEKRIKELQTKASSRSVLKLWVQSLYRVRLVERMSFTNYIETVANFIVYVSAACIYVFAISKNEQEQEKFWSPGVRVLVLLLTQFFVIHPCRFFCLVLACGIPPLQRTKTAVENLSFVTGITAVSTCTIFFALAECLRGT